MKSITLLLLPTVQAVTMKFLAIFVIIFAIVFSKIVYNYVTYIVFVKGKTGYEETYVQLIVENDSEHEDEEIEVYIPSPKSHYRSSYGGRTLINFKRKFLIISANAQNAYYTFPFPNLTFAETLRQLSHAPPGNGKLREVYCDFGKILHIVDALSYSILYLDGIYKAADTIIVNHCNLTRNESLVQRSYCIFSGYIDGNGLACVLGGNFEHSKRLVHVLGRVVALDLLNLGLGDFPD